MAGAVLHSLGGRESFRNQETGECHKKDYSNKLNLSLPKYYHDCACNSMTTPRETTHIMTPADVVDGKTDIRGSKPRHSQYETHTSRLESFVAWPGRYVPKTPHELATAGFFYIGSADRVTCYHCGITLRDWENEHDPVTEHKRYAPNCDFIKRINIEQLNVSERTEGPNAKSTVTESGDSVFSETDIHEVKPKDSNIGPMIVTSDSGCDSPPGGSNADLHLGGGACARPLHVKDQPVACISIPLIKTDELSQQDTNTQISSDDSDIKCSVEESVVNSIPKPRKSKKLASLVEQNRLLKEQTTCRVCKDQAASILFLPCGHLVTCPDCAEKVKDCVRCGKTILGTVKTFRA